MLIGELLLLRQRMCQIVFKIIHNFIKVISKNGGSWNVEFRGNGGRMARMETIVKKERGVQSRVMESIVEAKFGKAKKIRPIGTLMINKATKVLLNNRVNSFHLPIGLMVIRGGKFERDIEGRADSMPIFRGELCPSICDDFGRESV